MHPLPSHVHTAPSDQNALDIFAGEWTSALPNEWSHLRAGHLPLFADPRILWGMQAMGGVVGKRVLELGPLEGAHSYLLEKSGAREVVAIESNTNAFLRCLVLKEVIGLERVRYRCGDFAQYLRDTPDRYDVVFASGVLYHQLDPMRLLADIAERSRSLFLWTHYFDAELIARNPRIAHKIGEAVQMDFSGFMYDQVEFRYETALEWSGFCGGTQTSCFWLTRDVLLSGLRHFGFSQFAVAFDEPDHQNGPALALVALK